MATDIKTLLEISLGTELIHTIIEAMAEHGIFINWRNNNGIPLDRSTPRVQIISKKAYDIVCALGYRSWAYQYYVMSVVNYMKHQQFLYAIHGPSLSQLEHMGGVPWEFSEGTLAYVYNTICQGQSYVMQMMSHHDEPSKNVKLG